MAAKTANVLARVEPEVKEQAEEIMSQLGIPVSVVINMLYKQIIMKKAIPFSLSVSSIPITLDEMDATTFNSVMENGLKQAKNGNSKDMDDVFSALHKELLNG
ncbi:MAG: type II toxin-antitoxin system RelB/DinJ family antitoxin [Ruminococcaceae bacterium]|nr:type II toxin-antitoxin system RelB/DinJ family antitoxin [Oscillospiraceae bacterium]